jgi:hypothetical protein
MEIDKIASAVASGQNLPGVAQSSGAQNSQIDELQRLADSIRKMENDCRITARVQGMSGSGLQTKLRQYDDLLGKVNQQIRELQRQDRRPAPENDSKAIGVTMLQYNTDAARLAMRSSGVSTGAAVAEQRQSVLAKAQTNAAERKAEQQVQAAVRKTDADKGDVQKNGLLDVLV